jgi:hypothetical protein
MADYYLDVYDTSGTRQAMITDFSSLTYTRRVNAPGLLQVVLQGNHPVLSNLADKWQIEVWRKPAGGSFARDFVGLARQDEFYYGDKSSAVLTCPGLMTMLAWRIVNWYAGTANRSEFNATAAETIMKTLVNYNAGSSATTGNGRLRNGAITGLTVETDGANGNSLDWFCSYENLLETLQQLALVAGGDFDLVKTSATAWQMRWYTGQLGTDRTASVIFALERGNMANPQYKYLRMAEKTVAMVGGQGEGSGRSIVIRTGDTYSASNDIEMFVSANDVDTTAGLQARGDVALSEAKAQTQFAFDVLQTPATLYGTHYVLGDLVAAVNPFTGVSIDLKIDQVMVTVNEGGNEIVDVTMVTP